MLQQMRSLSKSWISSIFLGGLALSFGVWGIADIFRGNVDTSIATVGGEKLPAETFQRDYRNFLRNAGAQAGHVVTSEEAHAKGLDKQALKTEINRSAIDQVVSSYGIRATDAQVSSAIRAIPGFRGPLGGFDHNTFLQRLETSGFTEDEFVAVERADLARSQLLDAVHDGFALPQPYMHLFFDYVNERRAADYVVVPKDAAGTPPPPTDTQLTAYLNARASQFSTPEYRDVTFAVAGPQDVMNQIHVSEDELRQQFELKKYQYQIPEKRDVDQITFPDQSSAKAARAKLDAGTTFDQLAFQRGLKSSDISLGTVVEDDLGKDRGPPTFALPAGGVTQPVKSTFGWVILRVTKITQGVNKSYADVKDELRKDVMTQLATSKLTDVTNAFDDASAGGASLADAAKRAGMRVVHIAAVDRSGLTPAGTRADLPSSADFVAQLQKSDVGEEGDPFPSSDGNVYVIKVNGVTPPKLKPLSEVRAQALAAWTADTQKQRLNAMATQLVTEGQTSKNLSAIAARLHANVQQTGALTHSAKVPGLSTDLVRKLFEAPPGGVVSAPGPNGDGLIVARVTGILHPEIPTNDSGFQQFAGNVNGESAEDYDTTMAAAARARLGVTINQKQVDNVTGS